jgi:8-oxo-dGTP pyrophosphatase MutT (NUDIX family)
MLGSFVMGGILAVSALTAAIPPMMKGRLAGASGARPGSDVSARMRSSGVASVTRNVRYVQRVVEWAQVADAVMASRVAKYLARMDARRAAILSLLQPALMSGTSQSRLRRRKSGPTLGPVNDHACDEYLESLPRKRVAAGVLLRDKDDRIVLIEPTYKDTWEVPGGVVEAGESPWIAAERELEEELGLIRRNMPVLVIDYVPVASDGMPEGLLWIFDGGLLDEAECKDLRGVDEEVKSARLLTIDEATERTKESLARRLRVALQAAQAHQQNVYCDQGRRRSPGEPQAEQVERKAEAAVAVS